MIVEDLSTTELKQRLAGAGLALRTGPVVSRVRSAIGDVAEGIRLHYARHTVSDSGFCDFHVAIERPSGLRRWLRPQVVFRFDGEAPFAPLPGDQGFPMLEWGLNWCVSAHCHQYLVLHAAVVAQDDRAVLMPAPSGSGKSTLCAGLVYGSGWRLLSDELALLDPASARVQALARPVSLKNASIEALARFAPQARFGQVVRETVKGTVTHVRPPDPAVAAVHEPAAVQWVVMPRYEAGAAAQWRPLPKAHALMRLVDNTFNHTVHGGAGFDRLAALVAQAECREFIYSDLGEACRAFEELAREA